MSLLTERNRPLKTPGKRPFEEGNFQSPTNTPKFKRSHANAVRNFPRLCGPFAPENEQKSRDFFGAAAVSVALLRSVPPNHENIGENDAINEKFKKFRSDIERMKLKWGVLLGDYCKEGADDDLANLKNSTTTQSLASANEASKVLKSDHSICRPTFAKSETDHVSFGISNSEIKQMEEIMETNGKSIQDDDGCLIISQKSSNVDKGKAAVEDQNVPNPVIRKNSSKMVQGEMSETHVFDWVEDNDNISCLSPSEWQNLNHKQSEKEAEVQPSEKPGNQSVPYNRDMEINVPLNNGQEVLNLYNDLCTKLSLEHREELSARRRGKQVHVKAAMILKKENKWVNINPTFGHVPGVEIGDQFQFRAELVVIGLHHEFICGINCTTIEDEVYANSIVDSGRYNNKVKSSDVLVYSGQGGNPKLQIKQLEDQKLERGNLALKNSMDAKFPIRVIRKTRVEPKKSVYIYDGLYNVTKFSPERSENGNMAFMFELVRMKGQQDCNQLTISKNRNLEHIRAAVAADGVSLGKEKIPSLEDCNKLKISKARQSIKRMDCRRAVVIDDDLSQGLEKIPIMVVNEINDEKPPPFTYISKMIYTSLHKHSFHSGCNCIGGCSDSHQCSCIKKNRGEPPFNEKGALLRAKKMIFECGPSCQCSPSCENRVSQHGPKLPLEVFRTKSTGWGVRSRIDIPSGSFICEYLGELLKDDEADRRTYDEYLFDLDDGNGFTIDAAKYGNVGRFINHSCSPNLYAQDVLYDHDDKKLPHVMFFATKNIPALQQLTYHYNYSIDRVCDANGKIRKKKCCCGSKKCIGRMY